MTVRHHVGSAINRWSLGRNDNSLARYDPQTGGCRGGLEPGMVNQKQGAESTLALLIALLELRLAEQRERIGS